MDLLFLFVYCLCKEEKWMQNEKVTIISSLMCHFRNFSNDNGFQFWGLHVTWSLFRDMLFWSIGLWQWYITILDIIHRPVFY
jgi:hypothetical protein